MTKKLSGKQLGEENFKTFEHWFNSKSDDDLVAYALNNDTSKLNRSKIAKELGFKDRKRVTDNARIKSSLEAREVILRQNGKLSPLTEEEEHKAVQTPMYEPQSQNIMNSKRLSELERENIELKTKIRLLESSAQDAQERNARFRELSETLEEIKGGIWG